MNELSLTPKEQLVILERSRDWYSVFAFNNNTISTIYENKICEDFCKHNHLDGICSMFFPLKEKILEVYKTKEPVFIPEYIAISNNQTRVLDVQIYPTNGHVVLCARDLDPHIYNLRSSAALLAKQLDELIQERIENRV